MHNHRGIVRTFVLVMAVAAAASTAACQKRHKRDGCEVVADRSEAWFEKTGAKLRLKLKDDWRETFVTGCHQAEAAGRADPLMECVLAASSDAAAGKCWEDAIAEAAKP
jgi:hypothetical protein